MSGVVFSHVDTLLRVLSDTSKVYVWEHLWHKSMSEITVTLFQFVEITESDN